jgi:hypothetical protein
LEIPLCKGQAIVTDRKLQLVLVLKPTAFTFEITASEIKLLLSPLFLLPDGTHLVPADQEKMHKKL